MNDSLKYKSLQARIFGLRFWVGDIEPKLLKTTFNKLLEDTDFNILSFSEYLFPNQGYTAMWLLAESHLAIHTFPQDGWSYIELSGCNKEKTKLFKERIINSDLDVKWEADKITVSVPEVD
jgi:S-adenosylmethionine decarboxylase